MQNPKNEIVIDNFLTMTPEKPEFSADSQLQVIAGVDPLYYLTSVDYAQEPSPSGSPDPYSGFGYPRIHEEQVAPLASARRTELIDTVTGNILGISPSSIANYDVNIITDQHYIYGIGSGGIVNNLGNFAGGATNAGNVMEHYNGRIYAMNTTMTDIAYCNLTSPGFSYVAGAKPVINGGKQYMKAFLDNLYFSHNSVAGESSHIVSYLNESNLVQEGIDLGRGWSILGMENYNNNYLVVAGAYSGDALPISGARSNTNYLFLWDGTTANQLTGTGGTYNRAVRIPGAFKDMKMIGDNLYVVVTTKLNQDQVFLFTGGSLQLQEPIAIDSVKDYAGLGQGYSLFNYNNSIGLNLSSGGAYIIADTVLGKSKYVLSMENLDIWGGGAQGGALYGGKGSSVYNYRQTVNEYSDIFMRTQWIDVDHRSVGSIKVWFEKMTAGNQFVITLYGKDENGTVYPITLATVDSTSIVEPTNTILDVKGFTGNKLRIDLRSAPSVSTMQLIIRKIVINLN